MRTIAGCILASIGFAASAFAACPDISGSYQVGDETFVKYEQTDCQSLKRYIGSMGTDGAVVYTLDKQFEDGDPTCYRGRACETVTFSKNAVTFERNFNGGVLTDDHGRCSCRKYSLSKDNDGNLVGVFSVFSCGDRYKGKVQKVFLK